MFWVVAAVVVALAAVAWWSSGRQRPSGKRIDHAKVREVERRSQERGFSA